VIVAEATGALPDQAYFDHLLGLHHEMLREHPKWAQALRDEPMAGQEQREYIHYTRAPLVVRQLASLVAHRSSTTLEAFMAEVWSRHGHHQSPFALQEELEAFTGDSYEDFWAFYVDQPGPLFHSWAGADPWSTDLARKPPAARASGLKVSGDYLFYLAKSGRFERFSDIATFVSREGVRRAELAQLGVHLVSEEQAAVVHGMKPAEHYALARAEADWPLHLAGEVSPEGLPASSFVLDESHPDGAAFSLLLADEAAYSQARDHNGLIRLALRTGDKAKSEKRPDVLGVTAKDPLMLHAFWSRFQPLVTYRIEVGGELAKEREVVVEPGWWRNRVDVTVEERSALPGVVRVRVSTPEGLVAVRSFWQR